MPPKKRAAPKAKAKPARRSPARSSSRAATGRRLPPQSVTPYLTVSSGAEAVQWYQQAFGAKVVEQQPGPNGMVMHATLLIGKHQLFLSDAFPGMDTTPPTKLGGTTCTVHLHTRDADKLFQRAVQAGAKVALPLDDQFWGDRYGKLTDPFGHSWSVSAKSKLSKQELEAKRQQMEQQMAQMAQGQGGQGSGQAGSTWT